MNKANILVTGGLGYIGSHTSVELINNSYNVTLIDSLINSEKFILERIEKITADLEYFDLGGVFDQLEE